MRASTNYHLRTDTEIRATADADGYGWLNVAGDGHHVALHMRPDVCERLAEQALELARLLRAVEAGDFVPIEFLAPDQPTQTREVDDAA